MVECGWERAGLVKGLLVAPPPTYLKYSRIPSGEARPPVGARSPANDPSVVRLAGAEKRLVHAQIHAERAREPLPHRNGVCDDRARAADSSAEDAPRCDGGSRDPGEDVDRCLPLGDEAFRGKRGQRETLSVGRSPIRCLGRHPPGDSGGGVKSRPSSECSIAHVAASAPY